MTGICRVDFSHASEPARVPDEPLSNCLNIRRYGTFTLTDAVRPAPRGVVPIQGYRVKVYRDSSLSLRLPMLSAAVSRELLLDAFLALLDPLGDVVNVVLESSHDSGHHRHDDYRRNHIDAPILASYCLDFEDILLDDGCTGIAVLSGRIPMEVQFDEHKLLCVYAPELKPFERILRSFGLRRITDLPLISEGEHLHHSTDEHADRFRELCMTLGVADPGHVLSDDAESDLDGVW
jgi:hypothetical protein